MPLPRNNAYQDAVQCLSTLVTESFVMVESRMYITSPENSPPTRLMGHPIGDLPEPYRLLGELLSGDAYGSDRSELRAIIDGIEAVRNDPSCEVITGGQAHELRISNAGVTIETIIPVADDRCELDFPDFCGIINEWRSFLAKNGR